jgi:two-component system, NtrC family, response regulator GlrR
MKSVSLLGNSPAFASALRLIQKLAKLSAPVLIEGETGTGKEMAARAIHYEGDRRDRPFVPVNCGAFPDSLFENELFGHVKGAYTDARADQAGLVEAADAGTLFLDEVDALTPKAQVSILRFLQDGTYRPVGSRVERRADVRIVAASNADLDDLAESGAFRSDLLFRLRILNLQLPPLRERGDDALLLARAFFDKCRRQHDCKVAELDESSCEWFGRYRWPGNIRELEGLIYREAMICDDTILRLAAPVTLLGERRIGNDRRSMSDFNGLPYALARSRVLEHFDRQYLAGLMTHAGGNVTRAARVAGKERRALGKLLKKHGLDGREPGPI